MENTFLDRLEIEHAELVEKTEKLDGALKSKGFSEKVGRYQFDLLIQQLGVMNTYRKIIDLRIVDLKSKNNE